MQDSVSAPRNRSRGSFLRGVGLICLGAGLGLAALVVWFNVFFYPGYGLDGLGRGQYQAALLRGAAGFAASESLRVGKIIRCRFKELTPCGKAFAWGTVLLFTPKGEEVYLWESLKWSPSRQRWQREKCLWLADPRDRLFFAKSLLGLGIFKKPYYGLANLSREFLRRLREVWGS